MSLKNANSSNLNFLKDKNNTHTNSMLNLDNYSLINNYNKKYSNRINEIYKNKENNNKDKDKKRNFFKNKNVTKLTDDVDNYIFTKKINYHIYNLKNKIFSLSNSINKQNQNISNYNGVNDKIQKNFSNNDISLKHINRFYLDKNLYNKRVSFTPKNQNNNLKYNLFYNNSNIERKHSYSIRKDISLITSILKEGDENNIEYSINKNNNKLLNKLYCYSARQKYNNTNRNYKEYNMTSKLLKTMKKSIKKNNSCHKNKINKFLYLSNSKNNIYKSDFTNYINSSTNNYTNLNNKNNNKIDSYYINNSLSPTNLNKDISIVFENILKSTSYLIDSMKDERKDNKFIKELNKNKNRVFISKFSYDKENNDVNDEFFNKSKDNKNILDKNAYLNSKNYNDKENINLNYIKKSNYEYNRNYKKKTSKKYRNTWKIKSYKTQNNNSYNYLDDIHKNYNTKCNIRPVNNVS